MQANTPRFLVSCDVKAPGFALFPHLHLQPHCCSCPVLPLSRPLPAAWALLPCIRSARLEFLTPPALLPHNTFLDSTPVLRSGSMVIPGRVTPGGGGGCCHSSALSLLEDAPYAMRMSSRPSPPPSTWSPHEGRDMNSPASVRLRVRT